MAKQKAFIKSRFSQVTFLVALLFIAGTVLLPIWRLFPEVTERIAIPLHYNVHSGVDAFGPWRRLFTVPIIGGVIFIVNLIAAMVLWKKEHVLSHFFLAVAAIAQILLFVAMIFIVTLNLTFA